MPDSRSAQSYWADKAGDWVQWADPVAAMAEKFNLPFLENIGLEQGHSLLDLASGAGEPAFTAASIAGPGGLVLATDFVPAMLSGIQARDRTGALRCLAADMQALPFADHSFDRVSCRFGIMFVPDADKAAAETLRVLKPGGRCGFMVWGPECEQTLFSVLSQAVSDILGQAPDGHHLAIFRFARSGSLADIFVKAGFKSAEERVERGHSTAPLARPFWQAQLEMTYGHLLTELPADKRQELDRRIHDLFTALSEDGGQSVPLSRHTRTLIADKD